MCHIMATKMWLRDEPSAYLAPDTLPHCHPGCLSVGHGHAAPATYTYLYLSLTTHSILHQPNYPIFPSVVLSVLIFLSLTGIIQLITLVLVFNSTQNIESVFRTFQLLQNEINEQRTLYFMFCHFPFPFSILPFSHCTMEVGIVFGINRTYILWMKLKSF